MVSGFLISPYDHDRIFSGDAMEIRIWSKTWAGVVGLKRFIISWFMVFSVCRLSPAQISLSPSLSRTTRYPPPLRRPAEPSACTDDDGGKGGACAALTKLLCRFGRRRRANLGIVQVDVEAERAHFLYQHVERFRNTRFERVVAANDRLVHLGTAGDVVRLHGQHFLQRVCRAVS